MPPARIGTALGQECLGRVGLSAESGPPRAQAAYRKMVAGLPALLSREPDKARVVLQRLFGQIRLARTADGGRRPRGAARNESSRADRPRFRGRQHDGRFEW